MLGLRKPVSRRKNMNGRKLLFQTTILLLGLLLLTACSSSFVIKDLKADENYQGDCQAELTFYSVNNGMVVSIGSRPTDSNGNSSSWCNGAKHTWIGKVSYNGYVFDSDENSPLQFKLDKSGYVYIAGKGSVTMPDGTTVTLPK
jgi:hypothetical protein